MTEVQIRVDGFDELRQGLRNIDKDLGKEMGKKNKSVGAIVARFSESRRSKMASRFPSYGSDAVSIKPSANQRRVLVNVKPAAAEWGTTRHPVFGTWKSQAAFANKVWPGPNREGWMVRPTVDEREADIADEWLDAVAELAHRVLGS